MVPAVAEALLGCVGVGVRVSRNRHREVGQVFHDAFKRRLSPDDLRRDGRRRRWWSRRCDAQFRNSEGLARRSRHATKDLGSSLAMDAERNVNHRVIKRRSVTATVFLRPTL